MNDFRQVMQESLNRALPHRGITRRIIGVGKDPKDASKCVIFSFNPQTKAESMLGQAAAQDNCVIVHLRGKCILLLNQTRIIRSMFYAFLTSCLSKTYKENICAS